MNLKATLTPVQNLRAVQNIGGKGGSGSTTWNKVKDKPFETLGEDFVVEDGVLGLGAVPVGSVDWDNVENKPFSTIGDGLEVNNGVLSADIDCESCIDNKSIVLDNNGKVSEAVPVWTETIPSETTEIHRVARRRYNYRYRLEYAAGDGDMLWSIVDNYNPINNIEVKRYNVDNPRDVWTITSIDNVDLIDSTAVYTSDGYHWKVYFEDGKLYVESSDYDLEPEDYENTFMIITFDTTSHYTFVADVVRVAYPQNVYSGSISPFQWGQDNPDFTFTYYVNGTEYTLEVDDYDYHADHDLYYTDSNGLRWLVYLSHTGEEEYTYFANFSYEDGNLPAGIEDDGVLDGTIYTASQHQVVHQLPAQYVPIDNETIINDDGILKAVGGGSDVSVNQILSSGTAIADITVDGATTTLYAPSGGSVNIDNKSLIEVSGVIQEAVPLYNETVSTTTTYGPGLYFDTFNYPAGNDLDCFLYTNGNDITLDTSTTAYDIVLSIDGTLDTGTWNAGYSASAPSYYGGYGSLNMNTFGGGVELYWSYEELQGGEYGYRVHVYLGGAYIQTGNVDFLMIIPQDPNDTLEAQLSTLGLSNMWKTHTNTVTETIYHKLPSEYYDKVKCKDDELRSAVRVVDGELRAMVISAGDNLHMMATTDGDGYPYMVLSGEKPIQDAGGCLINGSSETGFWNVGGETYATNKQRLYTNDFYGVFDSWGAGDYIFIEKYCLLPNSISGLSIKGILHLGDVRTDPTDISIEGWESILDDIYWDSTNNRWNMDFKEGISPRGIDGLYLYTMNEDYGKQNINAFYIPVDNTTIKTNSDGQLETAIPAPPAVNGTYTLQAVVSNGTITYSWI